MEPTQPISFLHLILSLTAGIGVIILLTARFRIHAFFALLIACFVVGLSTGMTVETLLEAAKSGFGHVMKSLALLIALGTALGVLLEKTGATRVMADFILRKTGEKKAPLAMSLTGFIVGLPIFCDSGYIVLSGLARSLAHRTGISMAVLATSLATGLYSVHCLIPPHPGMSAAAAHMQVDFGRLILIGILVSIPASIAGYLWANYAGKKWGNSKIASEHPAEEAAAFEPSPWKAFLPVIVPIVLIALKPFLAMEHMDEGIIVQWINILGEPSIALGVGILCALLNVPKNASGIVTRSLSEGAEKAGGILVIIGAGGAFGAVLAATDPAAHFSEMARNSALGILFPFLVTFVLKTAQGSSTVAIITASSLLYPLLPVLHMDTPSGTLLAVLSMGAGSMMISHANDAYFWVIARFSGLEMPVMLKVYTVASVWMGLTALAVVYLVSFWV